jgi:hypothetical protein
VNRLQKIMTAIFAVLVSLCVYSAIQIDEVNWANRSSAVPAVVYPYPCEFLVLRLDIRKERLRAPVLLVPRAIE